MSNLEYNETWLHLLWAVPVIALVGFYGIWQRRRALRMFASSHLLTQLAPPLRWGRPLIRLALITVSLLLMVTAIINPRWGEREQQVARRNIDVMVLLDVSRSMLAEDINPNRLERAKFSIREDLIPALGGDRIGLITFAGVPSLECPITNDYGFFRLALADVSTQSSPRGGTLIGDAIRMAAEGFPDKLNTHKIIVLITDGEDHESYPVEAASAIWKDHEVPIVAVALGDEREGARIPLKSGKDQYLEYEGQVVWTRANFDDLRRIAAVSDLNAFVPVGTRNFDLGEVYRQVVVPKINYHTQLDSEAVPLPSRYHGFALLSLLLLVIESVLRESARRSALNRLTHTESGAAA
ncbi:MAG: VWA domain-containing protein [Planctomycetota bacterium]